jgi:hypothetical protein
VLIHRARFQTGGQEHYFVNVTNLSEDREVEITHVWFETEPIVNVMRPDRPLPKRLKPDEPWETWISVDELPIKKDKQVYKLGRVRMSTGAIVKSQENRQVPSIGFVPGGNGSRLQSKEEKEEATEENSQSEKKEELLDKVHIDILKTMASSLFPSCDLLYLQVNLQINKRLIIIKLNDLIKWGYVKRVGSHSPPTIIIEDKGVRFLDSKGLL